MPEIIVIDPGHGGLDPGSVSGSYPLALVVTPRQLASAIVNES